MYSFILKSSENSLSMVEFITHALFLSNHRMKKVSVYRFSIHLNFSVMSICWINNKIQCKSLLICLSKVYWSILLAESTNAFPLLDLKNLFSVKNLSLEIKLNRIKLSYFSASYPLIVEGEGGGGFFGTSYCMVFVLWVFEL